MDDNEKFMLFCSLHCNLYIMIKILRNFSDMIIFGIFGDLDSICCEISSGRS